MSERRRGMHDTCLAADGVNLGGLLSTNSTPLYREPSPSKGRHGGSRYLIESPDDQLLILACSVLHTTAPC